MFPVFSYGSTCDTYRDEVIKHSSRIAEIDFEVSSERTTPFKHKNQDDFKVWSYFKTKETQRERSAMVSAERSLQSCEHKH